MSKLGSVLAVAVCVAVGVVAVAVADTTKKKTRVTLNYNVATSPVGPYYDQTASFSGKVKARGGCKKQRKVKLVPAIGKQVKTSRRGRFTIALVDPAPAGTYKAKVKKRVIKKKNGDRIVCKRGKSKPVVVP